MGIAWIGLLIEIIIFYLIKPLIIDFEVAVIIFIGVNAVIVTIVCFGKYNGKYFLTLYFAYVVRLLAMLWEIYARHIYIFPHSASDGDGFYRSAVLISENLKLLRGDLYGGMYAKLNGILFYLTTPERLIGQYINVLLGMSIVIITIKTLRLLGIGEKILKRSILIMAFFPQAIILSAVFLRENIITMLIASSFYFFVQWYQNGKGIYIFYTITCVLSASAFHSAVIFTMFGYIFMYMFYKRSTDRFTFSLETILMFVIFIIGSFIITNHYGDIFMGRFKNVDEIEDVYNVANSRLGDSTYLKSLRINSWWKLLLFSPIKMFYFLISPLPMDWRGISDIVTFFMDSLLYLYTLVFTLRNFKHLKHSESIVVGLVVLLLSVTFVFGVGVSNAGTAMRHRHKFFPLVVCLLSIGMNSMKNLEENLKEDKNKIKAL